GELTSERLLVLGLGALLLAALRVLAGLLGALARLGGGPGRPPLRDGVVENLLLPRALRRVLGHRLIEGVVEGLQRIDPGPGRLFGFLLGLLLGAAGGS